MDILPNLVRCFEFPYTSVRHMASRCFGVLSKVVTTETMDLVLTKVVDIMKQSEVVICRQGAIEAIVRIFSPRIFVCYKIQVFLLIAKSSNENDLLPT